MSMDRGIIVRFPRRERPIAGDAGDSELANLDHDLRTIDQAMRALAERKKGVLIKYRQALRRMTGRPVLLLFLFCATTGTPQRQFCRNTAYVPSICYANPSGKMRRRLKRTVIPT